MLKGIDESQWLANRIQGLSTTLAKKRGLPIVIGVFLVIVSFIISLVDYFVAAPVLELIWSITHHSGILLALIGLLLVEPLGK
jgi:hypothetical protein